MPVDRGPGHPSGRPTAQGSLQRRSAARTAVVWDALREVLDAQHPGGQHPGGQHPGGQHPGGPVSVVDIGGGTGGFAVRVAELGHRVLVVDPRPDALATLARRADESGVADRVTGRQIGPPLAGHGSRATGLVLIDDGKMLVTSEQEAWVLRWPTSPTAWVATACRIAGRDLSHEEWDRYLPGHAYRQTCTGR